MSHHLSDPLLEQSQFQKIGYHSNCVCSRSHSLYRWLAWTRQNLSGPISSSERGVRSLSFQILCSSAVLLSGNLILWNHERSL